MPRQLSTVVSDAVLAVSVIHFVYNVFFTNFFAALGLGIQGAAAVAGTVRFSMSNPDRIVKEYHQLFSWLAQIAGLPLLGIGYAHTNIPVLVSFNFIFMIGAVVATRFADLPTRKLITEATSGFGMLTIILCCLIDVNIWGLIAATIYVASGVSVGSEGYTHGIPRVDILHYLLAIGNEFFRMSLSNSN